MRSRRFAPGWTIIAFAAATQPACTPRDSGDPPIAHIAVDSTRRFQTILGWEATAQAGQDDAASFPLYRDSLIKLAVDQLGLTRLRLEIKSGIEHAPGGHFAARNARCARYATSNDNDDAATIDSSGFDFRQVDRVVAQLVIPFKRYIESRHGHLHVNATYVSFMVQCPPGTPYHHSSPDEYAEFVLATFLHLRDRWGLIPDSWEMILEPENTHFWRGRQIGEAMVATAERLRAHGFTPAFIAPSTTKAGNAPTYFKNIIAVPGALELLDELSYHRYRGVSAADIRAIGELGRRYGIATSMLERIGSGYQALHTDLTLGRVSAWQQFTLAYPAREDNGGAYYIIRDENSRQPHILLGRRTAFLRQYFRYIRPGATRVAASSDRTDAEPVVFLHPRLGPTVVVRTGEAVRMRITGLPAAQYRATFTTTDQTGAVQQVHTAGDTVIVEMPGKGVMTVFTRY